jgi:tetratricopeptide (TPR) repeat protein
MEKFHCGRLEESFARFERAAAKGHEESIWIVSVMKGVKLEKSALKEAFANTETPLGWWCAGRCSEDSRERFDFAKKSAEAGCSWGQVEYSYYYGKYGIGGFVERDEKTHLEWLEKAANQYNPMAMDRLGYVFREKGEYEKALSYYRASAELGWKYGMLYLGEMLENGLGCGKDLRQAVILYAQGGDEWFFVVLDRARLAVENETTDCDFDQLCYWLGWGLYWCMYGTEDWKRQNDKKNKVFGNRCIDYYCENVELQQESILTFLLCWNKTTGVKGPGLMIAQMVLEESLILPFQFGKPPIRKNCVIS